jgi:ribosomal protein S17E
LNAGINIRKRILDKRGITLAQKYPNLLKEWDFNLNTFSPNELSPGSAVKAHWICSEGHKWVASVGGRTGNKRNCPTCKNNSRSERATLVRIRKTGTLAEKHPELLKEWDYERNKIAPELYPPGSKKKVSWKCSKGHKWDATISARTLVGHSCQICSYEIRANNARLKRIKEKGSLESEFPDLLSEWDYTKNKTLPADYPISSKERVFWICTNKHKWDAPIKERTVGRGECKVCKSISILAPHVLEFWDYDKNEKLNVREITPKSSAKVWWKCSEGHSYQQMLSVRVISSKKCKDCNI